MRASDAVSQKISGRFLEWPHFWNRPHFWTPGSSRRSPCLSEGLGKPPRASRFDSVPRDWELEVQDELRTPRPEGLFATDRSNTSVLFNERVPGMSVPSSRLPSLDLPIPLNRQFLPRTQRPLATNTQAAWRPAIISLLVGSSAPLETCIPLAWRSDPSSPVPGQADEQLPEGVCRGSRASFAVGVYPFHSARRPAIISKGHLWWGPLWAPHETYPPLARRSDPSSPVPG
jgi:hypothetical protein